MEKVKLDTPEVVIALQALTSKYIDDQEHNPDKVFALIGCLHVEAHKLEQRLANVFLKAEANGYMPNVKVVIARTDEETGFPF